MSSEVLVEPVRIRGGDAVRLLVIQPDADCDLDRLGVWLQAQGVVVEVVRPFLGEPVPPRADHDGLMVLGGFLSSNDDADHLWLEDIRTLIRSTVEVDVPMLGICLGGQLLAQAFGGEVLPGTNGLEAGPISITWAPEAAQHPVLGGLPSDFRAGSFHEDAITRLHAGAVPLASSHKYAHQAFSCGSALGLQFHPEITAARLRRWTQLTAARSPERAPLLEQKADEFERAEAAVIRGAEQLAEQFLRAVRASTVRGGEVRPGAGRHSLPQ